MEWINFNIHKGISQTVISSFKKALTVTDKRDKFEETQFPPREQFYSYLKEECASEDDYAKAKKIWNEFNIQNVCYYHDLYLTLDVLLLADVFENFRRMSFNY